MPFTKLLLFIVLYLFSGISILTAQDDYQKWLEKEQNKFNKFLEEEDKAFSDFLKKDWKTFNSVDGEKYDKDPKPDNIPVAEEKEKPKPPPEGKVKPVSEVKIPEKKPEPKPKPKPIVKKTTNLMTIEFFGAPVSVNYKSDIKFNLSQPINNEVVSAAWETMASSKYKLFLEQIQSNSKQFLLNDWGYLSLVNDFAKKLFPASKNEQNLFTWFIMTKSGFEAKVAYKNDAIFLLMPNRNLIYENRFVTLDNKKFYFISIGEPLNIDGQIYTYTGQYKGSENLINMSVKNIPILKNQIANKTLSFKFKNENYKINVQYDTDVIDFFNTYPQTELKIYFNAAVSNQASYSLLKSLKPHVEGKSELEAVNFLLRFVQTAFDYKTDDLQFGKEKYLMLEETLFYPSSDCEDRSILFSYLVRNLLGMEVVGLDYPGHISTAVKFNSDIPGDNLNFNNQKYVICDPTYVNADAGMAMPQFKNVDPVVIQL